MLLNIITFYISGMDLWNPLIILVETRLGQLGANISPDRSSLTPQVLIGNFLKHNYPLLYELQHINLLCLYLPKEDGVSPDAEYITQIIFSKSKLGFLRSTARVILGQVLRIATCGTRTHRGDSL